MAIVNMKRLRLLAMRPDRERLLRQLQKLGCVEIGEPDLDPTAPEWAALARPESSGLARAKEENALLTHALESLKSYDKSGGGLFQVRPEISEGELFDENDYAEGLGIARTVADEEQAEAGLLSEQGRLLAQKATVAPWLPLDVPLETQSDELVSILFGTTPAKVSFADLTAALTGATELACLYEAGADQDLRYLLLVCHASVEELCLETLRSFSFARVNLRNWTGTARENDQRLDRELALAAEKLEQLHQRLAALAPRRELLRRCVDRSAQDVAREEAKGRMMDTQEAFLLEGWIPAESEEELGRVLSGFLCAWETREPDPEEYPEVPVSLKNNWFTRPLNMVTEMYSLPAYHTVDPNPLMAPFFILFYGIMLADMGYGLLMILAGVIVTKKYRPRGTMGHMFSLAILCGISTFLMGALTGGFFGDFIPQIVKLISGEEIALPALFTPLDDTLMILVGSMALGLIHIITGMAVSFVQKIKNGKLLDAVWEEVTWWVVFAGLALMILGVTPIVLAVGGVMIVVGSGWNAKGFGKVTAIFGSLYNNITGYFGDILSYSRLMALMLAGSVIAQVFNTLGAIPGNVVFFVIVSLAGNALNFALNLLGCYVHDLRLQCLEYFGKFYQDGGRPFRPLAFDTKYVDVIEK